MKHRLFTLCSIAGSLMLLTPALSYADMGLKQEITPEGTIVYFDFDGLGYVVIIIVALVMILRSQRASLKRMAAAKRRRAAERKAAGGNAAHAHTEEEDLGTRALAAAERLKQVEKTAHEPRSRLTRGAAGQQARDAAAGHDADAAKRR